MLLSSLRLQNFRSCRDATVRFDAYTCLVGPNGAGKSTILTALNLLFQRGADSATDLSELGPEDFFAKDTSSPIVITACFSALPDPLPDALAPFVRDGSLVVIAKATFLDGSASVRQFGLTLRHPDFAPYFAAVEGGAPAADLKTIYSGLRGKHSDLPDQKVMARMEEALRAYSASHSAECSLTATPFNFCEDENGALAPFIEWIYIPAVKDATSEQDESRNTALGQLLDRRVRQELQLDEPLEELTRKTEERFQEIVAKHAGKLTGVASAIEARLQHWSHSGAHVSIAWNLDAPSVSIDPPKARVKIGDREHILEIARAGHGLQRSFILAVLQELSSSSSTSGPAFCWGSRSLSYISTRHKRVIWPKCSSN